MTSSFRIAQVIFSYAVSQGFCQLSIRNLLAKMPVALSALAVLAGCGGNGDSTGSSSDGLPKEIVIGAAIAKTGFVAPYDATYAAVEQLVKEVNARGGIRGHEVRMIYADTRSDPQQAVLAVQKVIEDGADVLIFTGEAFTAAAGSPLAEEENKLNLSIANEPGYGPPTTGRLSFSSSPSLTSEASAGASFLDGRGIKHPFLFRDTSLIYGKVDCSAFQQTWEKLGGTIAGSVEFENGDESVASQVSELRGSDADAVVMCSYPPGGDAETYICKAEPPLNIPITVFGGLADKDVEREELEAWREYTTASFKLRMLAGDHFFLNTSQSMLLRFLSSEFTSVIANNRHSLPDDLPLVKDFRSQSRIV